MEDSQSNGGMSDNTNSPMANVATNLHINSAKATNASIDLTTPPLTPPREPSSLDGPSRKMPPLQPSSPGLVEMEEVYREGERGGNLNASNPPALVVCEDIAVEGEEEREEEEGRLLEEEKELLEGEEGEVADKGEEVDEEQQLLEGGEEKELLGHEEEKELLGGEEGEKVDEGKQVDEGEGVDEEHQGLERREQEHQSVERDRKCSEDSTSPRGDDESLALVIDIPEPSGLPLVPSPLNGKIATTSGRESGSPLPQSDPDIADTNGVVTSETRKVEQDNNDKEEEELMEISLELPSSDEDSSIESESSDESQSITVIKKATPPLLCEGRKLDDGQEILPETSNAVDENHTQMKGKGEGIVHVENQKPVKGRPAQVFSDGMLVDEEVEGNLATPNVHQVAKLKRFFTTLQQFGNNMSSEVAEQVQELITALVNGTATIQEFHQEIQTVTNHPLKEFIIPFLRETLDHFRKELKNSSQALSDILGEAPVSSSVGLTPTLMDDELPVLPSAKQGSIPVASQPLTTSGLQSQVSTTKSALPTPTQPHPPPVTSNPAQGHSYFSYPTPIMSTGFSADHDSTVAGGMFPPSSSPGAVARKRLRRPSAERAPGSERGGQSTSLDKAYPHPPKRPRHDYATTPVETAVITSATSHHPPHPPPAYPHYPPPPPSHPLSHPPSGDTHIGGVTYVPVPQARQGLMADDWGHIEMMLTSVLGMLETTRQAVTMLKERIMTTQAELERKERDYDGLIQQRVKDKMDKIKRQSAEDKQHLLMEASKQMREAVAQVRSDMERQMAQAQTLAVQEALKEANMQSTSKESCWNCGRQATETCSGCNKARYCGTFCQHKDWGNHMHQCASGIPGHPGMEEDPFSNQHDKETPSSSRKPAAMVNDVAMASSNNTSEVRTRIVGISDKNAHLVSMQVPNTPNIAFTIKTEKGTT